MIDLYEEQIRLEKEAVDVLYRKEFRNLSQAVEQGRFDETKYGNALLKTYFNPIKDKIQEYLDTDYKGHTGKTQRYIKYLCDDADVLAYVVLQSLIKKITQRTNKAKVVIVAVHIANALRTIQTFKTAEESNPKLISYLGSEYRRASARRKKDLIEKHLSEFEDKGNAKTKAEDIRACSTLIDLVLHSGVNLIEKKLLWDKRVERYATLHLVLTPEVLEVLTEQYYISPTLALFPPMVVPPKDWESMRVGGYLTVKKDFIKVRLQKSRQVLMKEDIDKPMEAINKLQKVEWRVNKKVYDINNRVYESNVIDPRSPPTLPRLYGGIPTSTLTDIKDLVEPLEYKDTYTKEEKKVWAIWNKKREQIKINLDGENGRRLQYLMTMGVAEKMLEYDKFYYVYQLDYRGRVYPTTDFFNPQSKGYVKSMLEFAEGHVLNEEGLYWLKVHTANCYGLDKEPMQKRVEWFEENRLKILVTANNPMSKVSYWNESDSPYEFLAACFAYKDHVDGNEVHLPIQLDAVNSGIQMYSGLLRDKVGAKSTCVIGDTRSDLYQEVADLVNKKLIDGKYPAYITFIDKEGVEKVILTKVEANSMKGNFTRSMTKRNVMTVPYSVSLRGMKMQNWDVMDDMKLTGKSFWEGDEWVVNYLWTTLVHEAIFEIVKGARAGQEYLKDVVKGIEGPAMWHTPIYGLPVLQSSFKSTEQRVQTVLGTLSIRRFTDETKRQKQLASIAANFIHSIDSTILMYIVDHIGTDVGVIHDCFLVHPNNGKLVTDMYKEGYIRVMEADPLKMFSDELDPEHKVEIPYVNDLDLQDVYNSVYIIS